MRLELDQVAVGYEGREVAGEVTLAVEPGQIACLLGPSGSGKTTVLRAIAGFEPLLRGRILGDGELLSGQGRQVPPERRGIGLVFQDFALLPHLSCRDNVGFGLFALPRAQRRQRVDELLEVVGLTAHAGRYPHELSGGMQQRVALARALAPQPRLLLLDEPFSSLDPDLREKLSLDVRLILKQQGSTALLVTHSQAEAFAMADQVGVLSGGRLRQWASAYELYHRPASREVAQFIGEKIWLRGRVAPDGRIATTLALLQPRATGFTPGQQVDVLLRPDDIIHDDASPLQARVVERTFRGSEFLYTLALDDGTRLLSLVPSHHDHAIDQKIGIRLDLEHVVVFGVDEGSGLRG
ncbi:ABC transporter ATP-binding protein [Pseudomarimonas salicorniae]|uniref:ABC transporter ATP-binding protein n=1 Tax=Pseudomarimonas salicorniae TaxID=2933270 RepID=A0ABT0GH20_9GAMM|nr:ABC transporter ATP-binding protein [Lysobacter sp. CAU 1642]MCK7593839.1 ABC transporter ATP-binding protein [Lysobacter sp. CAU 1642]